MKYMHFMIFILVRKIFDWIIENILKVVLFETIKGFLSQIPHLPEDILYMFLMIQLNGEWFIRTRLLKTICICVIDLLVKSQIDSQLQHFKFWYGCAAGTVFAEVPKDVWGYGIGVYKGGNFWKGFGILAWFEQNVQIMRRVAFQIGDQLAWQVVSGADQFLMGVKHMSHC